MKKLFIILIFSVLFVNLTISQTNKEKNIYLGFGSEFWGTGDIFSSRISFGGEVFLNNWFALNLEFAGIYGASYDFEYFDLTTGNYLVRMRTKGLITELNSDFRILKKPIFDFHSFEIKFLVGPTIAYFDEKWVSRMLNTWIFFEHPEDLELYPPYDGKAYSNEGVFYYWHSYNSYLTLGIALGLDFQFNIFDKLFVSLEFKHQPYIHLDNIGTGLNIKVGYKF